jgi:hypothetical protein
MCWNHDGSLLASASGKGTVLRVHRLPQAAKAFTFRRGTYPAPIHSLAFSPASVQPPLLCAASGHGTVHLFRLEEPDRCSSLLLPNGFLSPLLPILHAPLTVHKEAASLILLTPSRYHALSTTMELENFQYAEEDDGSCGVCCAAGSLQSQLLRASWRMYFPRPWRMWWTLHAASPPSDCPAR